eukprot:455578-Rhodomonas_salina.1
MGQVQKRCYLPTRVLCEARYCRLLRARYWATGTDVVVLTWGLGVHFAWRCLAYTGAVCAVLMWDWWYWLAHHGTVLRGTDAE